MRNAGHFFNANFVLTPFSGFHYCSRMPVDKLTPADPNALASL
jgi:hypothetical protein